MVHIFGSSFGATIVRNILFLECENVRIIHWEF